MPVTNAAALQAIELDFRVVKRVREGVVLGVALALGFVLACGSEDPAGPGGTCSLASDCQLGLICVTQKGKGTCTSDLSKVVGQAEPDGAVAAVDGGDAEAIEAGASMDGGTPMKDSGGVDAAGDSGAPKDAEADG